MLHYRRFHKLCSVAAGTFYSSPATRSAWDKLGKEFSEMNKSDQQTRQRLAFSFCSVNVMGNSPGSVLVLHRNL